MNLDILKIASDTNNNKSIKNYTHHSKLKNSMCGDEMQIDLVIKKNKIVDFGYQGKSCVYCQASASLLSKISINENKSKINELCDDAKHYFEGNVQNIEIIGLGDSPNDLPLLLNSDIKIVIPGIDGPNLNLLNQLKDLEFTLASEPNGYGWKNEINKLINKRELS